MSDSVRLLIQRRTYLPMGRCIYCGRDDIELTDEHIIPHGIGGRLELPDSSCIPCRDITSRRETWFQNKAIGGLKTLLRFPPRRGRKRRKGRTQITQEGRPNAPPIVVEAKDAPAAFLLPALPRPELLLGAKWPHPITLIGTILNPSSGDALFAKHGSFALPSVDYNLTEFCLILAKIAHSYALAEIAESELATMTLLLPDLIRNGATEAPVHVVGGDVELEPKTAYVNEIALAHAVTPTDEYLTVRIRLFAAWHTPTYYVLVGRRPLSG